MAARTLRREMFVYHDWAMGYELSLARTLTDAQLDQRFEMGMGSLRATLHHLCGAERLWLDRWQKKPFGPITPFEAGISVDDLANRFRTLAAEREAFFDSADENQTIHYRRSANEEYTNRLADMMLHVANHGVHHRAQGLNMLRRVGATVQGIDYLSFRLFNPTVQMSADTIERLSKRGARVADPVEPARFDVASLQRYYEYGDWATAWVFDATAQLDDPQLDRPFEMGPGSLRKTLQHIRNAEKWWFDSWVHGPESPFPTSPDGTPVRDIRTQFEATAAARREYLTKLSDDDLQRPVFARPGGATVIPARLGEAMLQLCCHGTHHRAQLLNMLRQLGQPTKMLDLIVWLRESGATVTG